MPIFNFSSPSMPPAGPPPKPSRQEWEAAVLTRFFPPKLQKQAKAALLTPGFTDPYLLRPWEAQGRYQSGVIRDALVERLCQMLSDELQAGRRLVQMPLSDLHRLKRNVALAFHAIHIGQLYGELARRPGVQAQQEVQRILALLDV
jgi:hypothetical protein